MQLEQKVLERSEHSLSVDDEALHPVLLGYDVSRPDIIARKETFLTVATVSR